MFQSVAKWQLLLAALTVSACGGATSSTAPGASPSAGAASTPQQLPGGCTDVGPCTLHAGSYISSGLHAFIPGLQMVIPDAGWRSTSLEEFEFNLIPPDRPNDRLFMLTGLVVAKSTGAGHGETVSGVGATSAAIVGWLTGNPDLRVATPPAAATLGNGISATTLVVGVSPTAQYGDASCPSNPRCADVFNKPGSSNVYGLAGDEVYRTYAAGGQRTFFVLLDAESEADLAHLEAEVSPILSSLRLPAGVVVG